jgi:hypothetical protein
MEFIHAIKGHAPWLRSIADGLLIVEFAASHTCSYAVASNPTPLLIDRSQEQESISPILITFNRPPYGQASYSSPSPNSPNAAK